MTTLTFEHMIRAETPNHVCRIWRGMRGDYATTNFQLREFAVSELRRLFERVEHYDKALHNIVMIDGVSAVEIIDKADGAGVCVSTETGPRR